MDFLGVGIVTEDPADIEWSYRVYSDLPDKSGHPMVIAVNINTQKSVLVNDYVKDAIEYTCAGSIQSSVR